LLTARGVTGFPPVDVVGSVMPTGRPGSAVAARSGTVSGTSAVTVTVTRACALPPAPSDTT
jgi:hypothetical protein